MLALVVTSSKSRPFITTFLSLKQPSVAPAASRIEFRVDCENERVRRWHRGEGERGERGRRGEGA